jgi:hypothetical protein
MEIRVDEKKTEDFKFYHPTSRDYKFWTEEENNLKKTFLEESFSIKKYYSHNFFKNDNIRLFSDNGKDFLISNVHDVSMQENCNLNINMPNKMFFFKDPFFYREKIKYFDVKTPVTEILYISDFFKEKTLGGFFSQNFDEKINYSIEYRNSIFKNEPEKNSKNLLLTTFNYQDCNDHKKLWGHYIYQNFDVIEKKELPKWDIRNYKNVFLYHKKFIHSRFYINFVQKIYSQKQKSLFFKTYMEYEKYSLNYLLHPKKNHFNHFGLRNGLFFIFNEKKINIEIGSISDKVYYQLFNNNNYKNINSLSIQTKINYPINNIFELYSNGKYIAENNDIKNSYLQANIMLNAFLFSKLRFITRFSIYDKDNEIHNNLILKNPDCYRNKFFLYRKKTIDFTLSSNDEKKYYISFYVSRLNHVFQEQEKEKGIDQFLYPKSIQLYGLKVKALHDIWKFQLNNILLCQKYNSNPYFLSKSTIFYKDHYFNQSLFVQTGFSFYYFNQSHLQAISYPFNFQYFNDDQECNKIIKTPFVNYFINMKIHRIILYFKIQNIGFSDIKNTHKMFIQTGFLWNLFT